MKRIAEIQSPIAFSRLGSASPERLSATNVSQVPIVTTWKTPTMSSEVEWCVRSSSWSYSR